MSVPYKKVLILGATSGIGQALAEKFITNGSKVIAVGRRQENLDKFEQRHGSDKVSTVKFDITDLDGIPSFAKDVLQSHPDLDGLLLNSGIQRSIDFSKPDSIDLSTIHTEVTTNYLSYVHMLKAFLPHFLAGRSSADKPQAIMLVTSSLAIVPMLRCGNYCATKAALHQLLLVVREQVSGPGLKVIEIAPPAVQTELHDEKHQPDIKNGRQVGLPLDEYITATWGSLSSGKDECVVETSAEVFEKVDKIRKQLFHEMIEQTKKNN